MERDNDDNGKGKRRRGEVNRQSVTGHSFLALLVRSPPHRLSLLAVLCCSLVLKDAVKCDYRIEWTAEEEVSQSSPVLPSSPLLPLRLLTGRRQLRPSHARLVVTTTSLFPLVFVSLRHVRCLVPSSAFPPLPLFIDRMTVKRIKARRRYERRKLTPKPRHNQQRNEDTTEGGGREGKGAISGS